MKDILVFGIDLFAIDNNESSSILPNSKITTTNGHIIYWFFCSPRRALIMQQIQTLYHKKYKNLYITYMLICVYRFLIPTLRGTYYLRKRAVIYTYFSRCLLFGPVRKILLSLRVCVNGIFPTTTEM